ncbi:ATP-binding cassette domain-containing protein [Mycetocola tolaasinivorans]|uniref:ATP-binding cassette domain-containing protein n=1 Tax=Mycetocola tolaasinivorans TaxID=76635 RepID=A0A3L7A575_9MICO|nr:ATP-binding cassette domain-containing protein [Mycetocola tolaasinivorans]RLP75205.1 ATP-binding cassette domain-containing protein [Mycetocola tolaasinivorans]
MPVVTVSQVSKSFRGVRLFRDVSFGIEPGTLTLVSGVEGVGKTQLLRLLCGLAVPDSGTVTIDSAYLTFGQTLPESFGIIIDRPRFIARRTGVQNLRELALIRRLVSEEQIHDTMRLLELDPTLALPVFQYTPAMRQQLALAQALMENPRVLILDEPFRLLPSTVSERLVGILQDLVNTGVTIVISGEVPADIRALSTRELRIDAETVTAI